MIKRLAKCVREYKLPAVLTLIFILGEAIIETLIPFITADLIGNIKDEWKLIGHGDAKVFQSIRILKRAGYDGYCSIEFEGMEDKLRGIEVGLKNLKRFIAEA